jgi:hypothetical protein
MEPSTAIGAGLAILGAREIIQKILGPTADYIGQELRNYTEKGAKNLKNIFTKAEEKLGPDIERPGKVPPKVLKGILTEGYYCEDQIGAEYFGGVLASSRSEVGRDDRGTYFISLLGRMSTYQIRAHYIFYSTFRRVYQGVDKNLGLSEEREKMKIFIPIKSFFAGMIFTSGEDTSSIIPHIMNGLCKEELIGDTWISASRSLIKEKFGIDVNLDGILFVPSAIGCELFIWAYGLGRKVNFRDILNPTIPIEPLKDVLLPDDAEKFT